MAIKKNCSSKNIGECHTHSVHTNCSTDLSQCVNPIADEHSPLTSSEGMFHTQCKSAKFPLFFFLFFLSFTVKAAEAPRPLRRFRWLPWQKAPPPSVAPLDEPHKQRISISRDEPL